jgi:endonuclease/exonuclease/phosphatase (EEP) superfamily protein YafD
MTCSHSASGRRRPTWAGTAVLVAAMTATLLPTTPAAQAAASPGRSGTGIVLGELPTMKAPVGRSMQGKITTAVANLPNRTTAGRFASSLRLLTAGRPDFVTLNEVSGRSIATLRAAAAGYDAYRDPTRDVTLGGTQSLNNVVMWRTDKWRLLDGGRVKLVDDDRGYRGRRPFTWDRYATWTVLRRIDGAVLSVVSTHMMTNPAKFPRQHGSPRLTRVQQYGRGMDILTRLVRSLATRGPVLVGGDMNSHLSQGGWTAPAKLTRAGYAYAKNRGVLYLFHQRRLTQVASRQVHVASDHPALITTLALNRQGPA